MDKESKKYVNSTKRTISLIGKYPGRTLHRIGTALGSIWITSSMINFILPLPDLFSPTKALKGLEAKEIKYLAKPVTILILGVNKNESKIETIENEIKANKINHLKSVLLIKFKPMNSIQLIEIPIGLKVILPGSNNSKNLAQSYKEGGIALCKDIISETLNLQKGEPQRYLLAKSEALNKLVNNISKIDSSVMRAYAIKSGIKEEAKYFSKSNRNSMRLLKQKSISKQRKRSEKENIKKAKEYLSGFLIAQTVVKPKGNTKKINILTKDFIDYSRTNMTQKELKSLSSITTNNNNTPLLIRLKVAD